MVDLSDVKLPEVPKAGEQPRGPDGKFQQKKPLEFTWPHFWLEVGEVWLAILLAQATWELGAWLLKS
jgi:hypothetical protein